MKKPARELGGTATRRLFLSAGATSVLTRSLSWTDPARAAGYPIKGKPIRVVVGLAGGAGADSLLRIVAEQMTANLGATILVDNKPGASMMLAAQDVARSAPDGYTLMYSPSNVFAQNPHTMLHVKYDPFVDFTSISLCARGPLVLAVNSDVGATDLRSLIAIGRKRPQGFAYGSFGVGSSSHIYGELFAKKTGIPMVHLPFKGGAEIAKELLAGRIDFIFDAAAAAIQNEKSGKVRILAVCSPTRVSALPNVPTMSEEGMPGMDLTSWLAFFGPAHLPTDVVSRLNGSIKEALAKPSVIDFYRSGGYEAEWSSPEELTRIVKTSYDGWGRVVSDLGMPKQ